MQSRGYGGAAELDEKRRDIFWMAVSFVAILAIWLGIVLVFGYQPLLFGLTYDEAVMGIGLAVLLVCSIVYLVAHERDLRARNRRLMGELTASVARLDEQVERLNGLCTASADFSGCLDLERIAGFAVDALLGNLGAERAGVVLFDEETGYHVYSRDSQETREPAPWPWLEGEESAHFANLADRLAAWNEDPALICISLRLENGLAGLLAAFRQGGFRPDHRSAATLLANMAAEAMESAQRHAELRESYLATVRSLVYSLDARDNYTATHCQRVASLSLRVAEHLGLPESLQRDIEVFGPLHDVGKIGIRDEILLRPGPLSAAEWAVCREHCLIGERILRPLKPSREALALVRNHHESWDGSGYPDGLIGGQIPILARLLAVVDAYDAMIADRPHRPPLTDAEVRRELLLNRGTRYDPQIVDALFGVLDEPQLRQAAHLRTHARLLL